MTSGKRSISVSTKRLPQMMMGMLNSSPKTTRPRWSLAAPAMPMTLSRLITASAMMIVFTAPRRLVLAAMS